MRVAAHDVQSGDIVRGIGLQVEFSEPATDFHTRLQGTVSTKAGTDAETGEHIYEKFETLVDLPNEHLVNVRLSDAHFRQIRIERTAEALEETTGEMRVQALWAVATMPRHRRPDADAFRALVEPLTGAEAADDIVDAMDALPEFELEPDFAVVNLGDHVN